MSGVLILDDNKGDKDFIRTISETMKMKVDVCCVDFRDQKKLEGFFRHLSCFLIAIKAWRRRKKYSHFLFMPEYAGFYYAAISKITFTEKSGPFSLVLFSIFNHKSGKFADLYYKQLVPWFFSSHACTGFATFSQYEKDFYTKNLKESVSNKVYPILFGAKLEDGQRVDAPNSIMDEEKYYFSGGRSNRDYKTLIEAFRGLDLNLKIACEREYFEGFDIPENVEIVTDAYGKDFVKLMKNSQAIILPMIHTDICAGLRTLIDAMREGKALVVTGDQCMEDYIESACMMPVRAQEPADIRMAVEKLSENNLAQTMSAKAKIIYEQKYTVKRYGNRMAKVLMALQV